MLYDIIKIPARWAIHLYCRNIRINNKILLQSKGPLLLACNHPNSFLDAIVLATLFDQPVYSLTRGDTFKKQFYAKLLGSLNMLPVYRISEGAENLGQNYETFDKCKEIFKQNGIVLIFSEGRCINEWHLRPLKKGTARLAMSSWQEDINLTVLPVGINYQSFTSFGKNLHISFGTPITEESVHATNGYGNTINNFNEKLNKELKQLVFEANENDTEKIRLHFLIPQTFIKKILLFIPAVTGYILHAPLYIPLQRVSWNKGKYLDHYDSVLVGLLFILYPFYLLLLCIIAGILFGYLWAFLMLLLSPLTAWSFVQIKKQF